MTDIEISARAFAELIHSPSSVQGQVLTNQKYPRSGSAPYMIPYYSPALTAITKYYKSGNVSGTLPATPAALTGLGTNAARRDHNWRVVSAFANGRQPKRQLSDIKRPTRRHTIDGVTFKATVSLEATEKGRRRFIIYDNYIQAPDRNVTNTTIELFFAALTNNGVSADIRDIEYVWLQGDKTFTRTSSSKKAIKDATFTAKVISAVWPLL
jgi:hypothetical protein